MDPQMLQKLGQKMGVVAPKTLRKAEELVRLLGVGGGGSLALSTSARAVICLETAATLTNTPVDRSHAIKLSGLTRPQYVASSQTVSRLLNLSPSVCIADLCVTHSATQAKDLAARVLKQYEAEAKGQVEVELPVYQTAAVVAACKVLNVKVDKRRVFESSRSKRAVYTKVVDAMTKVAEALHQQKKTTGGSKRGKTLLEMVEDNLEASPEKKSRKEEEHKEEEKEDFEEWKKKILEAAAAAAE